MTGSGVWSRCFVDRQSVVNVVPMVGCNIGGIDAEHLDGIDQLQDPFDFRPAGQSQQALSAGLDPGYRRIALPRRGRAQDIDAREYRSKVVGCPADESEDAAGSERQDASIAVQHFLQHGTAKPNAILDALFEPQEFDRREAARGLSR